MPPWRLSGVVVGAALNDPRALAALGDAVAAPPHLAAPRAPVLYVKPRHTLAAAGAPMVLPSGAEAIEVGATVGLVIGRTACRIAAAQAAAHVAGVALVVDLALPQASWYRPAAAARALDGSCRIGTPLRADRLAFDLEVQIDGATVQRAATAGFTRGPAQLLADVSEFMTLASGDLLLVGVPHGAPLARRGERVRVAGVGLGAIEFTVVAEAA